MAIEAYEHWMATSCMILSLIFSIYYFIQGKKTNETMQILRKLYYGFSIMYLFLFITRLIDNPMREYFDPTSNKKIFGIPTANQELHDFLMPFDTAYKIITFHASYGDIYLYNWMFVNLLYLVGIGICVYRLENTFLQKTRSFFSIILMLTASFSFFLAFIPNNIGSNIDFFQTVVNNPHVTPLGLFFSYMMAILGYGSISMVAIIYWILAARTTGRIRKYSIIMGLGYLFVIIDFHTVGHGSGGWERSVPTILGFFMMGISLAGFKKMFPVMIDFYKTKHTCIVCKTQLDKKMFLCSECGTFYCIKCKEALVESDNACWNCKVPIDGSRLIVEEKSLKQQEYEKMLDNVEKEHKHKKKLKDGKDEELKSNIPNAVSLFSLKDELEKLQDQQFSLRTKK